MLTLAQLKKDFQKAANPKQAKISQRFFRTGKGEYGEGDIFLGIKVPVQRQFVKKYCNLPFKDIQQLLNSKIHEHRLVGVLILVAQYIHGDDVAKKKIFLIYLQNTHNVNNWDLVDFSAPNIVGHYFLDKPRKKLYTLARSRLLWERRIAMLATFTFIRNNDFKDALALATILLDDEHDLIHKAVGWM
ncbi:MAG TPA: DNA alkylation repair protein, partial [Candidatus Cloacimonetes bacterium]|nr:DNA alkylation repair protein [Candidatus Cloacimonadota bacterium]